VRAAGLDAQVFFFQFSNRLLNGALNEVPPDGLDGRNDILGQHGD
jgi:hypothetical protein